MDIVVVVAGDMAFAADDVVEEMMYNTKKVRSKTAYLKTPQCPLLLFPADLTVD